MTLGYRGSLQDGRYRVRRCVVGDPNRHGPTGAEASVSRLLGALSPVPLRAPPVVEAALSRRNRPKQMPEVPSGRLRDGPVQQVKSRGVRRFADHCAVRGADH